MSNGPGKGDKWREHFDYKNFRTNMDLISGEHKIKPKTVKKLKHGHTRYTY